MILVLKYLILVPGSEPRSGVPTRGRRINIRIMMMFMFIINIMVFVVKERTKELGIRKALGAKPGAIVGLILQESIFITTLSGYVGILLAIFTLDSIGPDLEEYFITDPQVDLGTIITATFILIIVGAIAGYIPAKRAAKIRPVVALADS